MITVSFVILDCSSRFLLAVGSPPAPPTASARLFAIDIPSRCRRTYCCHIRRRAVAGVESESRQALRAVVRDVRAGNLVERTIRLDGVAHQLRGISVNL